MVASDQDVFDHYVHIRIRPWTEADWDGVTSTSASRRVQNLFSATPDIPYAAPTCEFVKARGIPCGENTTHVIVSQIDGGEEERVFYCITHARQLKDRLVG